MRAIVLAGGFGTRLRERVADIPKPMAPVAGRPFLELVLDRLVNAGIDEIVLSVGYRAEVIMAHFGHLYRNTRVRYSVEAEPLGTGGAVLHALEGSGDESFLVLNGDTLLMVNFGRLLEWYDEQVVDVAMVLCKVADAGRYGTVCVTDDMVSGFLEKERSGPGLINAGIYILARKVFEDVGLKGKFSLEYDLLQRHCDSLRVGAFITSSYFIDIGIPEDYDKAQRDLLYIYE